MLRTVALLAPLAAVAIYSNQDSKSDIKSEKEASEKESKNHWVSDNIWVYLEDPIGPPRTLPGDYLEYDAVKPMGPVQESMQNTQDPVKALSIMGDYMKEKDKTVMEMWKEFIKPKREIQTRSTSLPITQVNILNRGGTVDKEVSFGNRYYDAPVPRWTGTDRYYKRQITVPFYVVP